MTILCFCWETRTHLFFSVEQVHIINTTFPLPKGKAGNCEQFEKGILLKVCFPVWQCGLENTLFMKTTFSQRCLSAWERKILWHVMLPPRLPHREALKYQLSALPISKCYSALTVAYGQSSLICSELKFIVADWRHSYLTHCFLISAVVPWEKCKKEIIFIGFVMSGTRISNQPTHTLPPAVTPKQKLCLG